MNVVLEEKAAAKQREDQEGLEPVSRKKKPEKSAIVTELEAGEEAMEEELTAVSDNREEEENAEISARGSSEHDNRNAVPTTPRLSASVF